MHKPPKLLLGALIALGAMAGFVPSAQAQQAGTTLTASKSAEGYWEHRLDYDWSIEKTASPTSLTLEQGQSSTVNYQLTATKTLVNDVTVAGARGQVCVTNGGEQPTEGLAILDVIQIKTGSGPFVDYVSNQVDMSAMPVLAPYQSYCYDYDFEFTPVPGAEYRNVAQVTITNHSGWLPGGQHCELGQACPFGPDPKAGFSLGGEPTLVETDETANLSDLLTCPTGFTCTMNPSTNTWILTGTTVVNYTVTVQNNSAVCNENVTMPNVASLTEGDSGTVHTANASVSIYTGECGTGGLACTNTIGYWKTHAGFGPQEDAVTPLLPQHLGTLGGVKTMNVTTAQQAVNVLNMNVYGTSSNGITKLYAQLLGAKLSIARGADDTAVASAITAADTFLATHDWNSWSSLSKSQKNQVLSWVSIFDNFNNGLIGPGHCE